MIWSFILCLLCVAGIAYIWHNVKQLLKEIDDNLHGDS